MINNHPAYLTGEVHYDITDASRLRGVNRSTVFRWIVNGKLQATRYGNEWLIRAGDLAAFTPNKPGPKRQEAKEAK